MRARVAGPNRSWYLRNPRWSEVPSDLPFITRTRPGKPGRSGDGQTAADPNSERATLSPFQSGKLFLAQLFYCLAMRKRRTRHFLSSIPVNRAGPSISPPSWRLRWKRPGPTGKRPRSEPPRPRNWNIDSKRSRKTVPRPRSGWTRRNWYGERLNERSASISPKPRKSKTPSTTSRRSIPTGKPNKTPVPRSNCSNASSRKARKPTPRWRG